MASADPMLVEEYEKYVYEMEEQGQTPISFKDFVQQIMSGMAEGGIARLGYANGQLVQPGPGRPGYQGDRPPSVRAREHAARSSPAANPGGSPQWQDVHQTGAVRQTSVPAPVDVSNVPPSMRGGAPNALWTPESYPPSDDIDATWSDVADIPEKKEKDDLSLFGKLKRWRDAHDLKRRKTYALNYMKKNPRYPPQLGGEGFIWDEWTDKDYLSPENLQLLKDTGYLHPGQFGNVNIGGGGGGQGITSQYPYYIPPVTPGDDTVEDTVNDIPVDPIRFASDVPSEHDFSGEWFYGADGGRSGFAGGGDVRQNYGLGKLVKKAFKAIGKVAKSPVGKAALMVGLGGLGGFGPAAGLKGSALGKFLMGTGLPMGPNAAGPSTGLLGKMLLQGGKGWSMANLSPWKSIMGASALGGLYTGMTGDDDEEPEWLKRWRAQKAAADVQFAGISDPSNLQPIRFADGGRTGYKEGGKELSHREAALAAMYRPKAQEGGLMNLGGMEKDYRQEGGFVPLGGEERADDVPARLSKNEFVFTADAVRAAGGGDIDAGAEVMENVMENLEQGGQVSEESQGLEGARNMFATAQRLEGVL
jgi:hypothetical protein